MKRICILGSTGSIGTQTLEVIKLLKNIEVVALSGNTNIKLLEEQLREFKPKVVAVSDEAAATQLAKNITDTNVKVVCGISGICSIVEMPEIDMVVNAVVGNVGLEPTIRAIKNHKDIALANKETLVTAGEIIMKAAKENGVIIYPIDSEHSAIYQCLQGNDIKSVAKIHITASGGPFRTKTLDQLQHVTLQEALNHPNWSMGKKITIDSATMMNKGLEVIEARWLFDIPIEHINVVVHPQSIIHSMVEYVDGSVMAQLGEPDMRLPIQYALIYPERVYNDFKRLNFFERNTLTFEKPDIEKFHCLALAFKAIKIGGTMPAVMNGANEAAVAKFLNNEIRFTDISFLIERTMEAYTVKHGYSIEDICEADSFARLFVNNLAR